MKMIIRNKKTYRTVNICRVSKFEGHSGGLIIDFYDHNDVLLSEFVYETESQRDNALLTLDRLFVQEL